MVKHDLKVNILFFVMAVLILFLGFFYYLSLKEEKIPITTGKLPEESVIAAENPREEAPEELPEEEIITEEIVEPPKPKASNEILVYIKDNSFQPKENYTISKGATVVWKSADSKMHRIACYDGEKRFFFSPILKENKNTSYTFNGAGKFLCIDAVFGIRSNIIVKEKSSITGAVIGIDTIDAAATKISMLFLLIISLTVFVSLYRKKWQTS